MSKPKASDWPADKVERWPIGRLLPSARNARTHSKEQVAQIAASIQEWGWTVPVLVDEGGNLIAGHGRVLAAQKLKLDDVPTMVARGWTDEQKRAYALADNQLAMNAGWDTELLRIELSDLKAADFDLALTGFDMVEVDSYLRGLDTTADQEAEEQQTVKMLERFGGVPFTVFNARDGWWQDRKRAWIGLGIQSEVGRGENLLEFSDSVKLGGTIAEQQRRKRANRGAAFRDQDKLNGLRAKG